MQNHIIDLEQTIRRNKAKEKFLAFSGVEVSLPHRDAPKGGVVKVGGHVRGDGSGYLCLTFLIEADDDVLSTELHKTFATLSEDELRAMLGRDFIYLIEIGPERVHWWFVDEIFFYFKSLQGNSRTILQEKLLPALQKALPLGFNDLQWWGAEKDEEDLAEHKVESLLSHVRQSLGIRKQA
ncbi:MAG: hypothetical protein AB7D07_15840 [Desulfovibrionaceae bacterium]